MAGGTPPRDFAASATSRGRGRAQPLRGRGGWGPTDPPPRVPSAAGQASRAAHLLGRNSSPGIWGTSVRWLPLKGMKLQIIPGRGSARLLLLSWLWVSVWGRLRGSSGAAAAPSCHRGHPVAGRRSQELLELVAAPFPGQIWPRGTRSRGAAPKEHPRGPSWAGEGSEAARSRSRPGPAPRCSPSKWEACLFLGYRVSGRKAGDCQGFCWIPVKGISSPALGVLPRACSGRGALLPPNWERGARGLALARP